MGELYNPFPKLPKNIRQIGERDEIVKLYVEDYVNTYLKRLYPAGGQDLRAGLLLGSVELNDGMPYIFIDGAMEMEDVTEAGGKVAFSESAWKKADQNMEQLFPKRTIQGWFLCGRPGDELSPLNYWKQHVQYFQGPNKLMYLSTGREGDETVYITSEDGFYKLQGYSVYYERNQMMQDYMVLRKDVKRIETDTKDKVITEFRKRMDEHKEEASDRHQTSGLLRGLCTAMSVVILAGGIVMFNNYEHMKEMESVIASAIPEKAEKLLMGKQDTQKGQKNGNTVVVEEAEGGVYPTASLQKESMSETKPDQQAAIQDGQNVLEDGFNESGRTEDGGQEAQEQSGQGQDAKGQNGQGENVQGQNGQGQDAKGQNGQGESVQGQNGQGQDAKGQNGQGENVQGKNGQGQDARNQSGQGQSVQDQDARNQSGQGQNSQSQSAQSQSVQTGQKSTEISAEGQRFHVVQEGETLYGICIAEYHTVNKLKELCELNGLEDENKIVSGQKLLLP